MLPSASNAGWLLRGLAEGLRAREPDSLNLLILMLRLRWIVSFKPHDRRHDGRRPKKLAHWWQKVGWLFLPIFYGVSRSPRASYLAKLEHG